MEREPLTTKIGRWYNWWFAVRWRTFLTWMVLAAVATYLVWTDSEWLDRHTLWMVSALNEYGLVFNASDFYIGNMVVALTWFQPVALRIGLFRTALWIVLAPVASTILAWAWPERWGLEANSVIFGNLCGLPGLLVMGVRTRPWLSLVGGLLSVAGLYLSSHFDPIFHWYRYAFLRDAIFSQAIYGAVMIWGTQRTEREGLTAERAVSA